MGNKNQSLVAIPDRIVINQEAFCDYNKSIELILYAVIIHTGENINKGHYYTYLKPVLNEQWYLFNDKVVNPVGGNQFLQDSFVKQNAYIIFYKRI